MARPENKQETETISVTLTVTACGYLNFLARNGILGPNANEIARHILLKEIDRMISEKYHDRAIPR